MISILMPMRNAARFVEAAARSVLAESEPLELIIIDDGSTDGSDELVRRLNDHRIRLLSGPQRGIAAALNTGLRQATGDLIVRCDADDLLPPGRLHWQSRWLRDHHDYAAVCGSFCTISPRGKLLAELKHTDESRDITAELLAGETRTHLGAFAIRATALRSLGGFREYFVSAEDIDVQLRLAELGRVWYEPKLAYCYRLHEASITHQQPNPQRLHFEQTARDFQRQRQTSGIDVLMRGEAPLPPLGGDQSAQSAREQSQGHLLARAWREHQSGQVADGVRTAMRACLQRPQAWRVWKSALAMVARVITERFLLRSSHAH